mmetsp:Transcript_5003/g.9998  ORF Transcript_5003/g.9998 Transcript_5003/m.9998 type:complete len:384 (-) Transcript_5003:175-1326(-)
MRSIFRLSGGWGLGSCLRSCLRSCLSWLLLRGRFGRGGCLCGSGGGFLLLVHEELDALVELRDDLSLLDEEAGAGGDVDGSVCPNGGVLSTGSADGETEGVADLLRLGVSAVRGKVGDLHVNGGTHSGAEVGGARGDVTVIVRGGEFNSLNGLDGLEHGVEPVEDLVEEEALLHAHDAELILLAEPNDALLVLGLPAPTAVRPVGGDAGRLEEGIGVHVLEHDVGVNELLVLGVVDLVGVIDALSMVGGKGVNVSTVLRVIAQTLESGKHGLLELDPLSLVHFSWKVEGLEVTADAHAHGELLVEANLTYVKDAALSDARGVPVGDVLFLAGLVTMVVPDDSVEEASELAVVFGGHGVATKAGVLIVNAGPNATVKGLEVIVR